MMVQQQVAGARGPDSQALSFLAAQNPLGSCPRPLPRELLLFSGGQSLSTESETPATTLSVFRFHRCLQRPDQESVTYPNAR